MRIQAFLVLAFAVAAPFWPGKASAQSSVGGAQPAASGFGSGSSDADQSMSPPPLVSGAPYSLTFASEQQSNYLRGGLTFLVAHDDDVLTSTNGAAVGDWSYSILPTISINLTRSRYVWTATYAPGFTFYQNTSAYNETDQNLALSGQYRLTKHLTLGLRDYFQRSSNLFSQPLLDGGTTVNGGVQSPNVSIVAPISAALRNTATADLTYQLTRNDMVGVAGTVSNLHFLNPSQVPGLYDSSVRGGSGFYSHRIATRHYVGIAYLYQDLLSYPTGPQTQTQTHTVLGFYTFSPRRTLSFTVFAGPQYAATRQSGLPNLTGWTTAGGASAGWQGRHNSAAASYVRTITDGGGLPGAVRSNAAALSMRQQFSKVWSGGVGASYSENILLAPGTIGDNGHTLTGTVSAQRLIGQHFTAQIGYSHIHQNYDVPALGNITDRNREWASISYQFVRPLGK